MDNEAAPAGKRGRNQIAQGMTMFAPLQTVDPLHLRDLLIVLFCTLSALASWATHRNGRAVQKREVTLSDQFVTLTESNSRQAATSQRLEKLEAAVEEIRKDLRDDRLFSERSSEDRSSKLHERIDNLERKVAEMPDRVVALLLNSKSLIK